MKKFFRIVVKGTPVIFFDLEVPQDASLPNFWNNVNFAGYVMSENFVVPREEIKHISVVTQEQVQQNFVPRVVN